MATVSGCAYIHKWVESVLEPSIIGRAEIPLETQGKIVSY